MYSRVSILLAITLMVLYGCASDDRPIFTVYSTPDNDLIQAFEAQKIPVNRVDSPEKAIEVASEGSGVLFLADGYPDERLEIDPLLLRHAAAKNLRLYVEYASGLPEVQSDSLHIASWERGVITTEFPGALQAKHLIVMIHDAHVLPARVDQPWMVMARVAGFDRAVYGIDNVVQWPILYERSSLNVLVATTQLSRFRTARFAPENEWQSIWHHILHWLEPTWNGNLAWTESVKPTFEKRESLPHHAARMAVRRGVDWYSRSRMLVHPEWEDRISFADTFPDWTGPAPESSLPEGDGSAGVLEGFSSKIQWDGSQAVRWWRRADCTSETAMAFALRSVLMNSSEDRRVAENLQHWLLNESGLVMKDSVGFAHPEFGLIGWNTSYDRVYYGDDNARVLLGLIATAAALESIRWDASIAQGVLGNFRTSGILGFRGNRLEGEDLQKHGLRHVARRDVVNLAPHYESWLWAVYLWLYDKTGYEPLYEKSILGITHMMAGYPAEWIWTNGLQQERARMLLPLSWLVRVDDSPEHREWLETIASDLLARQEPGGAIHEELGGVGYGKYGPPTSNAEYGTSEAPLIQTSGDPIADMLYTSNFALLSLTEAAAATGDSDLSAAADRLADFLIRIQVSSADHPELDGAWFRAFDTDQWTYWASNADLGWGAWAIETGWTQSWITTMLAMREMGVSYWEFTSGSEIDNVFDAVARSMME